MRKRKSSVRKSPSGKYFALIQLIEFCKLSCALPKKAPEMVTRVTPVIKERTTHSALFKEGG